MARATGARRKEEEDIRVRDKKLRHPSRQCERGSSQQTWGHLLEVLARGDIDRLGDHVVGFGRPGPIQMVFDSTEITYTMAGLMQR